MRKKYLDKLVQALKLRREPPAYSEIRNLCQSLLGKEAKSNGFAISKKLLDRLISSNKLERERFYELLGSLEKIQEEDLGNKTKASPSQIIICHLNTNPNGTKFILQMREEIFGILENPNKDNRIKEDLKTVDSAFEHLLSLWFNSGFLNLKEINWDCSARLLEKIIKLEAVHQINGWEELKHRMEGNRKLFGYFHPCLPNDPLIFIEVALVKTIPTKIAELIDPKGKTEDGGKINTAVFYSISNCEKGLKGINLGNILIKNVVLNLKKAFPTLKTFCTLSPIPTLCNYVRETKGKESLEKLTERDWKKLAAKYLTTSTKTLGDPVSRFHLDNGAYIGKINVEADSSEKGMRQSEGIMVNYIYELEKLDQNREKFLNSNPAYSKEVASLLKE